MSAVTLIVSFLYIPGMRHRFIIDPESARELFHFGKWVYFSSIVYFFAMNFDRLYFAKEITLAQLGVYGIARNLADRCGPIGVSRKRVRSLSDGAAAALPRSRGAAQASSQRPADAHARRRGALGGFLALSQ